MSNEYLACLFQISRIRQYDIKQIVLVSFVRQCVPPVLFNRSTVIFSRFLKETFRLFYRVLPVISRVSSIPIGSFIDKICDLHVMDCEKFFMKIIGNPIRSSSIRMHLSVPYLARILVRKEEIIGDLRSNFDNRNSSPNIHSLSAYT